ncbi:acyl carrier protein [Pantoea sp. Cy-639]|uniref:acyl carrier protein n=1 Tax=Pantoea sp. Cy-639 TaxID=2608360 RepID=UPI00141E6C7D|nr:acyl carrier protein [Pantoea sp. Cy-639]NIF18473.1 acyl carrier protein [Pantoea sp. Cy-639]
MHAHLDIALHLQGLLANFLEQSLHRIRPDIALDELGADSFDVFELQALIEESFEIRIDEQIHTYMTFAELVDLVHRTLLPKSSLLTPPDSPASGNGNVRPDHAHIRLDEHHANGRFPLPGTVPGTDHPALIPGRSPRC